MPLAHTEIERDGAHVGARTLFASVGAQPPDGSNAESARAFNVLLDGRRIREDLGFKPKFPRLADAIAAGAWTRHSRGRAWRSLRMKRRLKPET